MSRWFRHYAGMMRDEKLVRVAVRVKQPVERVVWVWGAILESAAEINDGGRFDFDANSSAKFLSTTEGNIRLIADRLADVGYINEGCVAGRLFICGEDRERPASHIWRRLRSIVFERDDYTCQYCKERGGKLECDHVVPVAKGGVHAISNLVTACFSCNRAKRDKLVTEWIR